MIKWLKNSQSTKKGLRHEDLISEKDSKYVYNVLLTEHPQLLIKLEHGDSSMLSIDYSEEMNLEYLFVGVTNSDEKRAYVKLVLEKLNTEISFAQITPLIQVRDTSFASNLIDEVTSKKVFHSLSTQPTPVLIVKDNTSTSGYLSSDFNDQTSLGYLFKGTDTGEIRSIGTYDGTSKVAELDVALSEAVNVYTHYELFESTNSGKATAWICK